MALEDRCSPQSAPSPPGLPHSPPKQTTATTTITTKTNNNENNNNSNNNTTTALKDMSLPQTVTADTSPVAATMLPHSVAASLYQQQQLQHLHQLQQLQQLHQQQLAAAAAANCVFPSQPGYEIAVSQAVALQQRLSLSPGAHSTSSTPASSLTIKEEENDSIMGDGCNGDHYMHTVLTTKTTLAPTATKETPPQQQHMTEDEDEEDDIDVDDVDVEERQQHQQQQEVHQQQEHHHYHLPPPAHQQSHKPTLAFSISNILSDRFGGCEQQQQQQHQTQILANVNGKGLNNKQQQQQQQRVTAPANNTIFRPFDQARAATATPSAFTRVDLLEFSRQQQAAAAAATAAMMLERANILNCFNPVAYPRIHEEILQSRMRRTGILPHGNANAGTHNRQQVLLKKSNDSLEKSALGSLCKTVSQIGQNSISSSPPSSSSCSNSLQSAASLASSINDNKSNSSSSQGSTNSINASPSSMNNASSLSSARLISSKSISPQPIPPPSAISRDSGMESSDDTRSETGSTTNSETGKNEMWPAWVFCTRYSDRPSSGPRYRRPKQPKDKNSEEKRPRTAFSSEQLARLKREFNENRYLTERRRQQLSSELGLNEAQIKIWFQNKRAKIKKSTGTKNPLALQLMAQGLYNHTTVPLTKEEEELEMRMNGQIP